MKAKLLFTTMAFGIAHLVQAQNVGIGTQVPGYTLTVKDSLAASGNIGFAQVSPDGAVAVGTYVSNESAFIQTHTNNDLQFTTNNNIAQMTLQKGTGYLGIGTASPGEKLEVNGNVKINGILKISGGLPAAGKVLTSDAMGSASWQAPVAAAIANSGCFGVVDDSQPSVLTVSSGAAEQSIPFLEAASLAYTFDAGNNLAGGYTVPAAGFYHFEFALRFLNPPVATQDGLVSVRLFINGTAFTPWYSQAISGHAVSPFIDGSVNLKLAAGDVVTLKISQNSGQALTIFNGAWSRFSGYRIY